MLSQQTQQLLAILADASSDERQIQRAANDWVAALKNPDSLDAILDAQTQLVTVIDWENIERAKFALMMSGALVENGFAPEPLLEAYAPRLPVWLAHANRLLKAMDEAQGEADLERVMAQLPDETRDWERLDEFYLPLMAALSASPEARGKFRELLPLAAPLSERHEGAYFLQMMLQVLHKAPILVLQPNQKSGFIGTFSGIADNFQLHGLLMAKLTDQLSPATVAVLDGSGPQTSEFTIQGAFNLYDYRALNGGELPETVSDEFWIWNEGTPAAIPKFEKYRVVITAAPSYARSWTAQRLFAPLRASVDVDRELDASEVKTWMKRLSA